MASEFPWRGHVTIQIMKNKDYEQLRLRVPSWAEEWQLLIDGQPHEGLPDKHGYLLISIGEESQVHIEFATPLRKTYCNEKVVSNRGKVALEKGPIVYCAEKADNPHLYYDELTVVDGYKYQKSWNEELSSECITLIQENSLHLIPYYAWDNREPGFMKLWLDEVKRERLYRN